MICNIIISPHSLSNIIALKTFKVINANTLNSILKGTIFKERDSYFFFVFSIPAHHPILSKYWMTEWTE